jgi:hypothetical protein
MTSNITANVAFMCQYTKTIGVFPLSSVKTSVIVTVDATDPMFLVQDLASFPS